VENIPGLPLELKDEIVQLILKYKKPEKIVLFGSRATGDFEEVSDIDLAIFAKDWESSDFSHIHLDLEDYARTPLKFDVADFYRLRKESLKEDILNEGSVIYDAQNDSTKD